MGLRDLLMNHGMAEGGLELPDVLNILAKGGVLVDVRTPRIGPARMAGWRGNSHSRPAARPLTRRRCGAPSSNPWRDSPTTGLDLSPFNNPRNERRPLTNR